MFQWTRPQNSPTDARVAVARPAPDPGVAPEPALAPDAAPTRRFTDAVPPCSTRLGGLTIRGSLTGGDSVELSGAFEGPIRVDGLCHVREGGRVVGDVIAGDAVIAGEVQGRLTVRGRLEMLAHARVLADVEAATVAIAEGCFIEGRIHMRGSKDAVQPTSFMEKRRGKRRAAAAPANEAQVAAPTAGARPSTPPAADSAAASLPTDPPADPPAPAGQTSGG